MPSMTPTDSCASVFLAVRRAFLSDHPSSFENLYTTIGRDSLTRDSLLAFLPRFLCAIVDAATTENREVIRASFLTNRGYLASNIWHRATLMSSFRSHPQDMSLASFDNFLANLSFDAYFYFCIIDALSAPTERLSTDYLAYSMTLDIIFFLHAIASGCPTGDNPEVYTALHFFIDRFQSIAPQQQLPDDMRLDINTFVQSLNTANSQQFLADVTAAAALV